ncbi:MAG TPA: division/cell wall cluster transcriptional repressor MraZ [Candidatus Saccharimonadales bacterium]|nr:division/cell wall cluster transcriptional repressor MraZ [Candidatus Saccharimonadales bacterium]
MFLGEYTHSLDSKGRISVPSKFRADLGASAIVTKGLDGCLFLYPKGEWEVMANKLASLPVSSSSARAFARLMLSGAMEVEIDKFGRVLLPGYLRTFAGIKSEVVVTGVAQRIEIWDKTAWGTFTTDAESKSSELAENLTEWEI